MLNLIQRSLGFSGDVGQTHSDQNGASDVIALDACLKAYSESFCEEGGMCIDSVDEEKIHKRYKPRDFREDRTDIIEPSEADQTKASGCIRSILCSAVFVEERVPMGHAAEQISKQEHRVLLLQAMEREEFRRRAKPTGAGIKKMWLARSARAMDGTNAHRS